MMNININLLQQGFFSFFDKKTAGGAATLANKAAVKMENITNKNLAEELHKPVIRKYWKKSTFTSCRRSLAADLPDIQLISKFNKGFRFLLFVIDIYNKYALVITLKDKKGITITYAFLENQMNQTENQTKYGKIKAVKFTIDQ